MRKKKFKLLFPKEIWIAFGVVAVVIVWIASSYIFPNAQKNETKAKAPIKVSVKYLNPIKHRVVIEKLGTASPYLRTNLNSQLNSTVNKINVKLGQYVKKGRVLALLDVQERKSAYYQAIYSYRYAKANYSSQKQLYKQGLTSKNEYLQTRAQFEEALSKLKTAKLDYQHTKIIAPYSGFISQKYIDEGKTVSPGQEILQIISINPIKILFSVAETNIDYIKKGTKLDIIFNKGKFKTKGKIVSIAKDADASSKMYTVEIIVPNKNFTIRSGETAVVKLFLFNKELTFIPSSAIILNTEGNAGIILVNSLTEESYFKKVTIVEQNSSGSWVDGLKSDDIIVVSGAGFLTSGEKVTPVFIDN